MKNISSRQVAKRGAIYMTSSDVMKVKIDNNKSLRKFIANEKKKNPKQKLTKKKKTEPTEMCEIESKMYKSERFSVKEYGKPLTDNDDVIKAQIDRDTELREKMLNRVPNVYNVIYGSVSYDIDDGDGSDVPIDDYWSNLIVKLVENNNKTVDLYMGRGVVVEKEKKKTEDVIVVVEKKKTEDVIVVEKEKKKKTDDVVEKKKKKKKTEDVVVVEKEKKKKKKTEDVEKEKKKTEDVVVVENKRKKKDDLSFLMNRSN
jgi:hypothetical protein